MWRTAGRRRRRRKKEWKKNEENKKTRKRHENEPGKERSNMRRITEDYGERKKREIKIKKEGLATEEK